MFLKFLRQSAFCFVLVCISYLIYLFPFIFYFELLSIYIPPQLQLFLTGIVTLLVFIYFRTTITFLPLKLFVYAGMAVGFYGLLITGVTYAVLLIFPNVLIIYLMPFSLVAVLLYGHFNSRRLLCKDLSFINQKITRPASFAFISDIHLGSQSQSHLKRILDLIRHRSVEALIIGGDLIDSSSFDLTNLLVLNELAIPIFFVTGNHEYYLKDSINKIKSLESYGIKIIDETYFDALGVQWVGIGDNQSDDQKLDWLRSVPSSNLFSILVVHQPSLWPKAASLCDLMLSGHTHAGQMAPFQWLVQIQFKFYKGLYKFNDSFLYVSSGAGCWGPQVRVGSKNEVVFIKLRPN